MADPPHSSGKHELRVIDGSATHGIPNFGNGQCAPFRDSEPVAVRTFEVLNARPNSHPKPVEWRSQEQSTSVATLW